MADTATTIAINDNLLPNYYVPKSLLVLMANLPLYEFAEKAPQPKGQGKITYWNSWLAMAGASSTLAEGGNNSLPSLSSRRVSATIAQFGRGHKITDLAEWMSVLSVREGSMEQLRYSAKRTLERVAHTGIFKTVFYTQNNDVAQLLSSVMSAVASSWCANTGTSTATNRQFQFPCVFAASVSRMSAVSKTAPSISAQLSLYGIRKAVNRLERLNAQRFDDGYFVAYAHPNAIHSLRKDKNWENWNQYTQAGQETMYKGEVGRYMAYGVRFVTSTDAPRYAVAAHSVVPIFIFGKQAFGITEVLGGLQMYVVTGPDSNNPFNTYSQLTYKLSSAAAMLNPSAGVILWAHELITN